MTADLGPSLLALARGAIARELDVAYLDAPPHDELAAIGATFVTLRSAGDLRGCIGTVDAWRPLAADVRANAVAAAFHDPRFSPMRRQELADVAIEVSLLRPKEPIIVADEPALRAALRPGIDGVVLQCGSRRATFLPQVWEQLPDPADFLGALKRKAGLPADYWDGAMRVSRYTVDKFAEAGEAA